MGRVRKGPICKCRAPLVWAIEASQWTAPVPAGRSLGLIPGTSWSPEHGQHCSFSNNENKIKDQTESAAVKALALQAADPGLIPGTPQVSPDHRQE